MIQILLELQLEVTSPRECREGGARGGASAGGLLEVADGLAGDHQLEGASSLQGRPHADVCLHGSQEGGGKEN